MNYTLTDTITKNDGTPIAVASTGYASRVNADGLVAWCENERLVLTEGELIKQGFTGTFAEMVESALVGIVAHNKIASLESQYKTFVSADVSVNGVIFKGGSDTADKLDKTLRIMTKNLTDMADANTVTFFDASNMPHQYTPTQANDIVTALGNVIMQEKFKLLAAEANVDAAYASAGTYAEKVAAIQAVTL